MSTDELPPTNPATRLLDACRNGDLAAAIAHFDASSSIYLPDLAQSWHGAEEIREGCAQALRLFPDLTLKSHTRHVGRGVVIDEGRATGTQTGGELPTGRLLDLPIHISVRHDQAVKVEIGFPVALVRRALGLPVDRGVLAVAEVFSAASLPSGHDLTTYSLVEPEREKSTARAVSEPPESPPALSADKHKRRARLWVAAAAAVAVIVAGLVWRVSGNGGAELSATPTSPPSIATAEPTPTPTPTPSPTPTPTPSPTPKPTSSPTPSPSVPPTPKPTVILKSDLAFGYDSARLSSAARDRIKSVARQVRAAGLRGNIYVDGYTDNLGSAAHGRVLSQERADAVARLLRYLLHGLPLKVIAVGHGEANPIASNATQTGRRQNRRVTITLPRP
jgi:outer membrane protein OmpA-like peptidoglycan-associated protein